MFQPQERNDMENLLWFFVVAVGPFLLAAAVIFALMRQRRLSRREKKVQNEKIADLYSDDRNE